MRWSRERPPTPGSPPDELLKGLLGERATGCWELNGLGKSETHTGAGKSEEGEIIQRLWHIPPSTTDVHLQSDKLHNVGPNTQQFYRNKFGIPS